MKLNESIQKIISNYMIESDHTFQLNNGQIDIDFQNFVEQVINDIDQEKYLMSKVSKIANEYLDLCDADIVYKLEYDNPIKYCQQLTIFVILTNNIEEFNGVPYIENKDLTYYSKNNILYAAIGLFNPNKNIFLKDTIVHELKHVYIDFKNKTNSKYTSQSLDTYDAIFFKNMYKNIDLSNSNSFDESINQITNFANISTFNMLLSECLYYCNKYEIEAYKENIFSELLRNKKDLTDKNDLLKCSKTYLIYQNIKKFLYLWKTNKINSKINNYINQKAYIEHYKQIFGSRKTLNNISFVVNKLLSRIEKIEKDVNHFYKIISL